MSKYCYKCEKDVELVKDADSNAQLCETCGTIIIHSASKLPPDTIISGFQIIEEIGRGGMGIVYRSKQLNLERHVALKVLADDLSKDEEFVERFFKEARAAASLNHSNIVQVYDAGSTPDGIYYFAMELIVGETLEAKIERDGCLGPKEAIRIAVKIAEALDYSWDSQKLTHGDIKPDNIILNSSGGAKLADLGLAKFMHDDNTETGIMATPLYAPPEIIKGDTDKIGSQSDMYSFGATLYQMLTGVPPFADDTPEVVFKRHLNDTPPSISEFNHKFAPQLVELVDQLLAKDPGDRPYAWSDISKALKKIREPEIEGKVFHTHHSAGDAISSSPEGATPEESTGKIKPLIFLLVAVVLVLLIAIGLVIISSQKKEKNGDSNKLAVSASNITKEAAEQLDIFKSQLEYWTLQQSLEKIEALIMKYGKDLPSEADVLLEKLQTQILKNEQGVASKKKQIEVFQKKLTDVLQLIGKTDLVGNKTSIKAVQSLSGQIEKIQMQASKHSHLKITQDDRAFLNDAYMQITSILVKYNQEQEKLALKKTAKATQRRIEVEKKRLAKLEQAHQNQLAINKTIDSYYMKLADYNQNKKIPEFDAALEAWGSEHAAIPADYSMRVRFMREQVISSNEKFIVLLIKNSDSFVKKPLPQSICPVKYRKYKVKSVEEIGVKLIMNEGKVSLGYTLKWKRMSSKVIATLIKERLLQKEEGKSELSSDEIKVVLSYILLKAPNQCEAILDLAPKIRNGDKRMFKFLMEDFIIAKQESKLIIEFMVIKKAIEDDEIGQAAELFVAFIPKTVNTKFAKRYAEELRKLESSLTAFNPAIDANKLIQKCADPKIRNNPAVLFGLCMVANARYYNVLGGHAEQIEALKDQSLAQLVAKSGVKDINARRIPFFYWAMEKTGTAWAYYNIFKESGKMDRRPGILKAMRLAAALDNGDWVLAKKVYDSNELASISDMTNMKFTRNWAASFIFARGMMDLQYGNGNKRQKVLTALTSIANNIKNPNIMPMNTALAMEFSLYNRQLSLARDLGKTYKYKLGSRGKMQARVALLYMLTLMQRETTSPKEFAEVLQRYQKGFDRVENMKNGDVKWCQQALNLINNRVDIEQIRKLENLQCDFPDVTARIFLTSLARYYCNQEKRLPPAQEKEVLGIISRKVKNIFVAGDLWRRLAIFKFALSAQSPEMMNKKANQLLSDYRISSTRFYPGIIIIKSGAGFASGKFNAKETEANARRFLKASAVMSDNDLKILDVISSDDPAILVNKFYLNNLSGKGYLCGVLAMMVNHRKPAVRATVAKVFNENFSQLSWEEKLLIKKLQTWQ